MGKGTAEGNIQTDPVLVGANLELIIGGPLLLVADQRPLRNKQLLGACWFNRRTQHLRFESCIRNHAGARNSKARGKASLDLDLVQRLLAEVSGGEEEEGRRG